MLAFHGQEPRLYDCLLPAFVEAIPNYNYCLLKKEVLSLSYSALVLTTPRWPVLLLKPEN